MKNHKKLFILTCASLLCTAMLNGCKAAPENETSAGTQAESQIQPATEKLTETQAVTETQKQTETIKQTETSTEAPDTEPGSDSASDEKDRYFYDEAGNRIHVSLNSDEEWADENGKTYTFLEHDILDNEGTLYYYDPPEARSSTGVNGTDTGEAVDLYLSDGSFVRLTKDSNGNWADGNGVTYTLGDDGATDSNGNFHPW